MDPKVESELRRLLFLPWTIVPEVSPEGDRLLRVLEVPSAVGHGETDEELERDLWDSLEESLKAYLYFGDPIPLPTGVPQSWLPSSPLQPAAQQPRFYIVSTTDARTGSAAAFVA
jgi:predicted RNase H-like HicB family nuclease